MVDKAKTAFIIGTGRCGTSWLGQMLNSHAEICVPPEIQLLFEYSGNGNRLFEEFLLSDDGVVDADRLSAIIKRGCPHNLEAFFNYEEFCHRDDTPRESLGDFIEAFYAAIAKSHGKSWLIEQTPWYGQRLDIIANLFPEAKLIHMVRDGRDVALSFSRTPWWHRSPKLNLARWQKELKKITLDAALYFDEKSYLEVKYENLVSNTEFELRRICAFLGLEFDANTTDPKTFIDYDAFARFDMEQVSSKAYSAWKEKKEAVVFSENVQAWRREGELFSGELPPEISYWLSRFGYDLGSAEHEDAERQQVFPEYSLNAVEVASIAQAQEISRLEQITAAHVEHINTVESDWKLRGELINELAKTIDTQSHQILSLNAQVGGEGSRNAEIEQAIASKNALISDAEMRLASSNQRILELEQVVESQAAQIQDRDSRLSTQSAQLGRLEPAIESQAAALLDCDAKLSAQGEQLGRLEQTIESQAAVIRERETQLAVSYQQFSCLEQRLGQQAIHIGTVEAELNLFRQSWYGKLKAATKRMQSQ